VVGGTSRNSPASIDPTFVLAKRMSVWVLPNRFFYGKNCVGQQLAMDVHFLGYGCQPSALSLIKMQ
jgi:hypothetical protein